MKIKDFGHRLFVVIVTEEAVEHGRVLIMPQREKKLKHGTGGRVMRLISQKGWGYIDAEYENGTIAMHDESEETRIIYSWDNNSEKSTIMAEYSSMEKAEKVLEDMTKMYGSYISCNGGPGILQGSGYQQAFCFTPPKVFRFPADDEVEV